jgi:hypothetical protein
MEDPPPGVYRRTGGKPIVKRMGRGRCRFAILACVVLAGAGLHAANAAAAGEDSGSGTQTSSNGVNATAQNVSNTSQTSTETQTGTDGGQSQTVTQSAPTEQTANAASVSQQNSTNASAGGSSGQDNHAGASSTAANTNNTTQQSAQAQQASAPQSAGGQSQSTGQSAPTEQAANASANSTLIAPTNVNVVIRLDSPGNDGPVAQTNSSQANADAGNTNSLSQGSSQSQNGAGSAAGQSQSSSQSAPTTQSSQSTATSTQVNPLNANIVIRNKSPGDEGPVTQTNSVQSTAGAANSNAVDQTASQPQSGSGPGSGQSQGATQSAPTVQTAGATATSLQGAPTNTSVMIDPAASDPNGSGAIGTLIQVWIPNDPQTSPAGSPAAGEVVGANSSTATASAGNTNHVTQSAVQQQDAGGRPSSGPPTQVGGGTQTQVLEQSAPTTQIASAEATSIQGGAGPTSISSAAAQASNVSEVTQSATQIQHGGVGGSQVQVIRQEAPTTQWVNAESTAAGSGESHSSSNSTNSGSSAVSQSAVQVQVGEGSQVQIVDQDVGSRSGGQSRATSLAVSRPTARATWLAASSGSPAESRSIRSESGRRDVRDTGRRAPQEPREPGPQESSLLGAPGNGAPGVSLWAFAALLVPFFLTAPWWARRHRSAAIRRLLSVVLRLERPG